jgi:phosphoribosylamine-glycine ligase
VNDYYFEDMFYRKDIGRRKWKLKRLLY